MTYREPSSFEVLWKAVKLGEDDVADAIKDHPEGEEHGYEEFLAWCEKLRGATNSLDLARVFWSEMGFVTGLYQQVMEAQPDHDQKAGKMDEGTMEACYLAGLLFTDPAFFEHRKLEEENPYAMASTTLLAGIVTHLRFSEAASAAIDFMTDRVEITYAP